MPDPGASLQSLTDWLQANWLAAIAVVVVAFIAFRLARPLVHRFVIRVVTARVAEGPDGALHAEEANKRAETLEDLLARLLKAAVILVVVLVAMTMLGLLPVIAGLGIVAAAITLAGQSIILDYLMGFLILIEGQYYQGDWISVGTVEGTVEEVGFRRTVIRDNTGTVHSISNGEIRVSSNLTRLYAALLVDVPVLPGTDIDRAAAIIDRVGAEMAADPAWHDRLLDPPRFVRVIAVTDTGVMLRASGRVRAPDRWAGPGELRRRLLAAFAAEGIELAQRGRVVMVAPSSTATMPPGSGATSAATPPQTEPEAAPGPEPGAPSDEPG